MCTADTIFTYHQDKLGTTHYDYFVGENDSGKTNNLHVANRLLYRNIFTVDVTAPNLSQFLGSDRDGACTIGEDEADNLDEDRDKMRIYKSGYTTGISVHRIDISFGRVQLKLKTFGFKMLTAEELPDARIAKGLIQRCIIFYCKAGNPRYDIAEVIKPGRDKKLERLLNDLNDLRNMLIIYRLQHYYDEIPDLKLNIKNREKQLFKPTIRIFQKSAKSLGEIIPAINKYLTEYRVRRANTFNAALYKTVKKLLEKEKSGELRSSLICITFKNDLHGKNIPGRSMSFECEDFKKPISQGTIIKTLKDIFGAESTKNPQDERCLKFDLKKLNKFSEMYEAPTEIKVISVGDINSNRSITKHTKISRKSRVKSKNRLSTGTDSQTVPRHRQGSFLQSKKGNLRGKQAQKRSKSAKNSSKNRPAHARLCRNRVYCGKRKKGVNS